MRNILISLVIFAVFGGVFYAVFIRPHSGTASPGSQATSTVSVVTPDYKKPVAFSASVTPEVRTQINEQLATVQAKIDEQKLNLAAWVNLGTLHKMGGDYAFAEVAWQFVADIYPSSAIPFSNLGDLYQNYLKDYPKAEENYLKAIEILPSNINAYASLFTLYHYQYKVGTGADAAILEQGLKKNPGNADLLELKKQL